MLLKKLILKNIRSFEDQTIKFPKGIVLLEGDIGSGKTTILKAIEFAIFGTNPFLKANGLMRKGKKNAAVYLEFKLDNKEISIKRCLKKFNDGKILQTKIQLIIDNISYLCSPTEARSKIINLLNYPKDLMTKNPCLLFRYTVYTPQEETKLILKTSNEEKNNIFGKLFSTDKYKLIRENSIKFKKALREDAEFLRGIFADLKEKEKTANDYEKNLKEIKIQKSETEKQLSVLKKKIDYFNNEEKIKIEKQNKFLELKKQKEILENKKQEKIIYLNDLIKKHRQTSQSIEKMKLQINKDFAFLKNYIFDENYCNELQDRKKIIQKKIDDFNNSKNRFKIKIASLNQQILNQNSIDSKQKQAIKLLDDYQNKKHILEKFILQNSLIDGILTNQEIQLKQTQNCISSCNTKISIFKKEMLQISDLSICPLCRQEISKKYRDAITGNSLKLINEINEEKQKQEFQAKILEEKIKKTKEISADLSTKKEKLIFAKKEISRIECELQTIKIEQNKITIAKREKENLQKQLDELNQNFDCDILKKQIQELEQKIIDFEKLKKDFIRKNDLEKYLSQTIQMQKENENNKTKTAKAITILTKQISELNMKIKNSENVEEEINKIKEEKSLIEEKTEDKKIKHAQLIAQMQAIETQKKTIIEQINKMTNAKKNFKKIKQIENWIENLFIPLMKNIENNVLAKIHSEFEDLFCKWFFLLVEDNFFSAYIDEDFCPVIEQNGFSIDFSNLSGGEQTAVALCYRLALNQVINSITKHIQTKDIIILDEPTDGFSVEQLDKLNEVMRNLSLSQIIIVSHEQKMRNFADNIIALKKTDNVSIVV